MYYKKKLMLIARLQFDYLTTPSIGRLYSFVAISFPVQSLSLSISLYRVQIIRLIMSEVSIRDVFLSMQLLSIDELVATSKTGQLYRNNEKKMKFEIYVHLDFRSIRKSRRSCYRPCEFVFYFVNKRLT